MYERFSIINTKLNVRLAVITVMWGSIIRYEHEHASLDKVTLL